MGQLVDNPEILNALETVLGASYSKIKFSLSIKDNSDDYGAVSQYMGSTTQLYLTFYIDQITMMKSPPPDVFSEIESKINDMLTVVDGVFTQREVKPFRDKNPMTIDYTLRIQSYNNFVDRLLRLARHKADKEFSKVLEAKLNES